MLKEKVWRKMLMLGTERTASQNEVGTHNPCTLRQLAGRGHMLAQTVYAVPGTQLRNGEVSCTV